jgi:Tol biopolymer transport system component/DNA-binding winged helix-turn-helix (wHTH) protein
LDEQPGKARGTPVSGNNSSHIVRFGIFEVDLKAGELRRSGLRVKLQEQPLQVLTALLEHPGEVVTRDELRNKLWPADTFVDFDHGLNAAIKRLRDALGESAETPIFVETVARRGYRFIGNVDMPAATSAARPRSRQRLTRRNALVIGLIVCALALLFLYYRRLGGSEMGQPTVVPVVTDVGEKYTPSLSPDGQHLAFAWNGGTGPHFSIYVKIVGTEESLRLTRDASIDFNPVWSPDGRYIAFCRILKGETGIYIIPASGGTERRLRETLWQDQDHYQALFSAGGLSWSPNGKLLAYSDRASRDESASSIFLLSLDSSEVRRLTSSPSRWDFNPEFSPDGQTLAFASGRQAGFAVSIYTVPVSGGEERLVTTGPSYEWGLAWTREGRDIVLPDSAWVLNPGWLRRVPVRGGKPERLQFGQDGIEPSIRGNRLVFVRQQANVTTWKRQLNSPLSAGPPERFISSTKMDSGPQFSPDGSKIAFESTRSGHYEVWMCKSDGSGLVQLTHFDSVSGTPRWSPDGRQIVFDSLNAGNVDVFVVDSQGGPPRRLTPELWIEAMPSWSRDGRWIYFTSNRSGELQVWKMPSTGEPAVQVTRHGGFAALESPDGKFLYYAKGLTVPGLWRIPTDGGEESEIISSLEPGYWGYWAVVENGIYYLDMKAKPGIDFFDLTTHRTKRVFDLENRPASGAPGLAVSPDRRSILYTQLDALNSDIILVENFR